MNTNDYAEFVAAVNTAAALLARNKSLEEIEFAATVAKMLADTLFAIAIFQRRHEGLLKSRAKDAKDTKDEK